MTVSIVKVKKFERLSESIQKLLLPLKPEIGKRIFIKPNVVIPARPETGVVTDPRIVDVLIDYCREEGANEIVIGEGPLLGVDPDEAFATSGFSQLAKKKGVKLLDLNTAERTEVTWRHGKVAIPTIVLDSYYVNVAKLKTHVQTKVSIAIKNQKGLLSPSDKKLFHRLGLHEPLAHLLEVVRPKLTVVDGIIALEGEGKPKRLDLLVAGDDIVAVDAACCKVVGTDPAKVHHIRISSEIRIGNIDDRIYGEDINQIGVRFRPANEEYQHWMKIYLWRNPYACSACVQQLSAISKVVKKNPSYWLRIGVYAAFRGLNFLVGKHVSVPKVKGKVICLGDCTKRVAEENAFTWVEGCPPKMEDILNRMV